MFAHGAVIEPGAGAGEEDDGEGRQEEGQVDHGGLVEEEGPQEGQVLEDRDPHAPHELDLIEIAARAEADAVGEGCQGGGEDVDGHAVDGVVGAEGDGGEGVDHVDGDPGQGAAEDAQPRAARGEADQEAGQGADGRQSFQTDVDHARPFGPQFGQGDEEQGDRHADGGQEQIRQERAVHRTASFPDTGVIDRRADAGGRQWRDPIMPPPPSSYPWPAHDAPSSA